MPSRGTVRRKSLGSLYVLLLFLSLSYSQIRMINIRLIDTYHCMDGEKSGNFTYTDANLHKISVNQHGAILQNDTLIANPSFQYQEYIHGNPQHRITKKTNPRCRFSYPREKKEEKKRKIFKDSKSTPKSPEERFQWLWIRYRCFLLLAMLCGGEALSCDAEKRL